MKRILQFFLHLIWIVFLTIVTQIGGVVWLISLLIGRFWKKEIRYKKALLFTGLYLISTLVIVPLIAPIFGRMSVQHTHKIRPTNYATVLLNRNYVKPLLNQVLQKTAQSLKDTPIEIRYLDANFPFIDEFPLLPHLSHDDGEKIDISLVYQDTSGKMTNRKKSISGYGSFVPIKKGEIDQTARCKKAGYFQYDCTKYATFGSINQDLILSEKYTKQLILAFLKNKEVGKIFLEPHLKSRMQLNSSRIRFHGCRSVRHDDHIHVQL